MTNRELMLMVLNNEVDDDGASYESCANYNIACPYKSGDKRAKCFGKSGKEFLNDVLGGLCNKCKMEWLEQEVDE